MNQMTHIEELMYSKCMKLAEEWAKVWRESKAKLNFTRNSYAVSNPWVNLWNAYCKNEADEEDVKFCFGLGYVSIQFEGDAGRMGKIQKLRYKK